MKTIWFSIILFAFLGFVIWQIIKSVSKDKAEKDKQFSEYYAGDIADSEWIAPSLFIEGQPKGEERELIIYGQDLISHTSHYFGPKGSLSQTTNGMNCQNCHLDAGTRPWGSNFGAVSATYPQYRSRSNAVQNIYGRVNDCFQRSLNGEPIDTISREMQAMFKYLQWLGKDVPKQKKPYGSGIPKLSLLSRAADPGLGRKVFVNNCVSCHGNNGEGVLNPSGKEYTYPPLWGDHSYNDGAGLYRLSNSAGFIKHNMPYKEQYQKESTLTDEQAWDVAAYVNSQPRPHIDHSKDYPVINKKPFDNPFGPYADNFSGEQHKYGPYKPILDAAKGIQTTKK